MENNVINFLSTHHHQPRAQLSAPFHISVSFSYQFFLLTFLEEGPFLQKIYIYTSNRKMGEVDAMMNKKTSRREVAFQIRTTITTAFAADLTRTTLIFVHKKVSFEN